MLSCLINPGQEKGTLTLRNEQGRVIDFKEFSYYHNLDQKLLAILDKLLRRNRLGVSSIDNWQIEGGLGKESTSCRIAEAFIAGLKS